MTLSRCKNNTLEQAWRFGFYTLYRFRASKICNCTNRTLKATPLFNMRVTAKQQ